MQLSTDARRRTDWGTPGNAFLQNQIVFRAETRANLDTLRPAEQVYALVRGRRLNQLSFAYDTLTSAPVKLPDGTKADELRALKLYEISLVPVGAQPPGHCVFRGLRCASKSRQMAV